MADKAMSRTIQIDNNLMSWNLAIQQEKNKHLSEAVAMKAASDILQTAMPDPNQPDPNGGQQMPQMPPQMQPPMRQDNSTIQQQ